MQASTTRKTGRLQARRTRQFFLYIAPWLVGFLLVTVFPMMYSLVLSFTDSSIGKIGNFVGLKNYIHAFTGDRLFYTAIKNMVRYAAMFVPLALLFALGIAMILNQKIRGRGLFRVCFYVPSICAGVAVTLLWGWMLSPSFGLVNYYLSFLGIQGPGWLSDMKWAMFSIVLTNLWTQGNMIVIFLAGLQDIPEHLYESARIDGANWWNRFRHVTLPMLSPTLFFNLVLTLISALQMFNQVYILTEGGPVDATYVYMLHVYNNAFRYGRMGVASTLSWLLLVFIFVVTMLVVGTSKFWVHYAEE